MINTRNDEDCVVYGIISAFLLLFMTVYGSIEFSALWRVIIPQTDGIVQQF